MVLIPRRPVLTAVLFVVAAFAIWRWQYGVPMVDVVHLTRGSAVAAVYASGNVEPTVQMKIAPKISGRLVELLVDERAVVKSGQKLAQMDDKELTATVTQLRAKLAWVEREAARAKTLLAQRTGTVQERDRTASDLDAARAALAVAEQQRSEYMLTAPADGTIIRRDGEVGEVVQANQTVFSMSCCAPLRITAEVDEEDISFVHPGQKALIRSDAFPGRHFEGVVDAVTPKGDPTARNFRVRLKIPEDTPLMVGMSVEVNIVVGTDQDAPLLPSGAVSGGKVWVVRDGRLKHITVTTGVAGATMIEVKSGIKVEDDVVLRPESWFRSEQRVRVQAAQVP
ncbi:MAG: efflux RND transporter periplasmic adaptor subunit [Alphaproteobacteria bacterium]